MSQDGYARAFFELGEMLGIPAQPISPQLVWERQMKPRLQAIIGFNRLAHESPLDEKLVAWITAQARPVLWSEIEEAFGRWAPTHHAFERLKRAGTVGAVFPESKPDDSGRQHWVVMP